ncbi:YhdH/YhfP family quinone oxidoreductase [Salinisphaera aquimarina]|uniref:YhdH/YhfP family quinone oxidoreductase n=1 Tax=Salinisphaera aquimarina TaxID=2094031 RepID=A0ABV7ER09_9GAMM
MNDFKALRVLEQGRFGKGSIVDTSLDELDPGDVVIKTSYAGVNYKDALAAMGAGPIIRRYPCIGGIEVVGEVTDCEGTRFKPGDRVIVHGRGLGVSHDGGFSEYVRVPEDWVLELPEGLDMREAAALGVAGHTAAIAIDVMEHNGLMPANGPVAVTGATGGVASLSINMLSNLGYDVVAVSRKQDSHDYLKNLGAARVLAAPDNNGDATIKPLEKGEWAGAVDSVGGPVLAWLLRSMMDSGVVASFGNAAGIDVQTTVLPFILRGVRLLGVNANTAMPYRRAIWQRLASDLKPSHVQDIATWIEFGQLEQAMQSLIQGTARGRYVLDLT